MIAEVSTTALHPWERVTKFDKRACVLADRHYSRRKPGSGQFMPPGQTIVMYADAPSAGGEGAVWGWWRPHPDSGLKSMNGLDGWTCSIFRNESEHLSSDLILQAELALTEFGYDVGPDGMLTYVWDSKIRSVNPGYCYKLAGWAVRGRSKDKRKTLLGKPHAQAGIRP